MQATDLICLSHLRWGFVYQRPNHLMSRAARTRRTFFVEEPILNATTATMKIRTVAEDLYVCTPHLDATSSADASSVEVAQRSLFDDLVARHAIHRPLLWFYTPNAVAFAGHLPAGAIIYDCMDELTLFQDAPPALAERERELFRRADLVFTGGHQLFEAKRRHHPSVHAFPSSVDAPHFARAREPQDEPATQAPIAHPRVGYCGVIDERVDLELVAHVADTRPEWQLVFLGPVVKIDERTLPRRPNIHYLGPQAYDALPAYFAGWDAAIMPFALNDATRFISPTKTLEYLAAGKPVVSTAVRDVVRPYGERDLVRIGDRKTFVAELGAALAEDPTERRARADAFVAATSWDRTWAAMELLVERALTVGRRTGSEGIEPDTGVVASRHVEEEAKPCLTI